MLPTRALGTQGLTVSALGLGCMTMSHGYGSPEERDERESIATIHRALELGVTLLDTAEVYGPFTNEELLGRALRGKRDQAILATKFGFTFDGTKTTGLDSRPEHVRAAVEGSLRRLGTDRIDLYLLHWRDRTPLAETLEAFQALKAQGKILRYGVSNFDTSDMGE